MVASARCQNVGEKRRLMNPGPATLASVMRGSVRSSTASASPSAFGFAFASLARTRAALVARSPWAGSRGGSTTTRDMSSPAGRPPERTRFSRASRTRASKMAKMFMGRTGCQRLSDRADLPRWRRGSRPSTAGLFKGGGIASAAPSVTAGVPTGRSRGDDRAFASAERSTA